MRINVDDDVEVKIKLKDGDEIGAIVSLVFLGCFEIRNFVIRKTKFAENKHNFFLSPPSLRTNKGSWVKIFFSNDKAFWEELEKRVLFEFDNKLMESSIAEQDQVASL